MVAVPGVEDVHDLHVWSLSSEVRALSAHVLLDRHPTLDEAHDVATAVQVAVSGPSGTNHAPLDPGWRGRAARWGRTAWGV